MSRNGSHYICSICGELGHNAAAHRYDNTTSKVCTKCNRDLPFGDFAVRSRKGSTRKKLSSECKSCDAKRYAVNYRKGFSGRLSHLVSFAKKRDKAKGRLSNIDLPFILELLAAQDYRCYYTGQTLTFDTGYSGVSIDRKDSSLGYVRSNVVLTSWRCNRMKSNLADADFVEMCRKVFLWSDPSLRPYISEVPQEKQK